MKRILALILVLSLGLSALVGCGDKKESVNEEENVDIRIGAMAGPTAMGMVKLKKDSEENKTENTYIFSDFATDASAYVTPIISGDIDIAALPSNLAANLYNKTDGNIQIIAVNTLGVLNLVERGNSVKTIKDLKGKTVFATGVGAVPEYTIKHILKKNGIDPDKDVTLQFMSDTTEALSKVSSTDGAIAILPQPFVTAAMAKVKDLRVCMDLNDEWMALGEKSDIVTGVVVARKDFIEKHPSQVSKFLDEYNESVNYTMTNLDEAADLVYKAGIVNSKEIAKKAMPKCHIVCYTGSTMKQSVKGFLEILYSQNPQSIGGKLPEDDFYYGVAE